MIDDGRRYMCVATLPGATPTPKGLSGMALPAKNTLTE